MFEKCQNACGLESLTNLSPLRLGRYACRLRREYRHGRRGDVCCNHQSKVGEAVKQKQEIRNTPQPAAPLYRQIPRLRQTLLRVKRYTPYISADTAAMTARAARRPAASLGVMPAGLPLKYIIII